MIFGALSPHPPIVVPEVGGEELRRVKDTAEGLRRLAAQLVAAGPRTVVVVGPHGPVSRDAFMAQGAALVRGDLEDFGAPQVQVEMRTDSNLLGLVQEEAESAGLTVLDATQRRVGGGRSQAADMDYASLVPLYYLLKAGYDGRVLLLSMAYTDLASCFRFGQAVASAADRLGRPVAVLASGDLSHRLKRGAPAGYDPRGQEFDRLIVDSLAANDHQALLNIDPELTAAAGECGLRPIVIMLGAISGRNLEPEVLSYEGPFGVGYAVVSFGAKTKAKALPFVRARREQVPDAASGDDGTAAPDEDRAWGPGSSGHPLVVLARQAVEAYVRTGATIPAPSEPVAAALPQRAGAFVSLHRGGELRGCIGTVEPSQPSLASEVIHNAIAAATEDPRFPPLGPDELADLEMSVDVLHAPEPVTNPRRELDPERFGVIVEQGARRGLLLPDLEGVDTPGVQVSIAARKAGIDPRSPGVRLFRFRVERYH